MSFPRSIQVEADRSFRDQGVSGLFRATLVSDLHIVVEETGQHVSKCFDGPSGVAAKIDHEAGVPLLARDKEGVDLFLVQAKVLLQFPVGDIIS